MRFKKTCFNQFSSLTGVPVITEEMRSTSIHQGNFGNAALRILQILSGGKHLTGSCHLIQI